MAPPLLRRRRRARCARHDSARTRSWRAGTYDLTEEGESPCRGGATARQRLLVATPGRPGPHDGRGVGEATAACSSALVTGLADVLAAVIAGLVMPVVALTTSTTVDGPRIGTPASSRTRTAPARRPTVPAEQATSRAF